MSRLPLKILLIITIFHFSCKKEDKQELCVQDCDTIEELIFQTGFDGSSIVDASSSNADIVGIDNNYTKLNDWESDLDNHPQIGKFNFQFEDGNSTQRNVDIVSDPENYQNDVLRFWIKEPHINNGINKKKGRVQANIYGNSCLKEVCYAVKMYIPEDFNHLKTMSEKINWLTIAEFWNNGHFRKDEDYPFRVTLNIRKIETGTVDHLYFGAHGQTKEGSKWEEVWEHINESVAVPIGEWIDLTIYLKEGDASNGRTYMSMTTQDSVSTTIFDIQNYTHHPDDVCPKGIRDFNPLKIYTSDNVINHVANNGGLFHVYWDDFVFLRNKRP